MSLIRRFINDKRGSVAVVYSIATLPLIGLTGAAIDYAGAVRSRGKLQHAADAAALTAVSAKVPTVAQREAAARGAFAANLPAGVTATPGLEQVTSKRAAVTASGAVKTSFMHLFKVSEVAVAARAVAVKVFDGPPPCVLALNPTAPQSLWISGSAQYLAPGCVLHSNSYSSTALAIENNTTVQVAGTCAVGNLSVPPALRETARPYCEPMVDPFSKLAAPPIGACVAQNKEVAPKDTATLQPGNYCGGLTIKGTATLQPGVYVISGRLTITSQSVVKGSGVTFYLTGPGAGFTIDAQGSFDLSAPLDGPYGGVLFFQNRLSNAGTVNTFVGGSNTKIMGSIYTPTQKVRVAGGSSLTQEVPFFPIIADQVEITGNIKAKAELASVTLPFPLPKSESGARLVD